MWNSIFGSGAAAPASAAQPPPTLYIYEGDLERLQTESLSAAGMYGSLFGTWRQSGSAIAQLVLSRVGTRDPALHQRVYTGVTAAYGLREMGSWVASYSTDHKEIDVQIRQEVQRDKKSRVLLTLVINPNTRAVSHDCFFYRASSASSTLGTKLPGASPILVDCSAAGLDALEARGRPQASAALSPGWYQGPKFRQLLTALHTRVSPPPQDTQWLRTTEEFRVNYTNGETITFSVRFWEQPLLCGSPTWMAEMEVLLAPLLAPFSETGARPVFLRRAIASSAAAVPAHQQAGFDAEAANVDPDILELTIEVTRGPAPASGSCRRLLVGFDRNKSTPLAYEPTTGTWTATHRVSRYWITTQMMQRASPVLYLQIDENPVTLLELASYARELAERRGGGKLMWKFYVP